MIAGLQASEIHSVPNCRYIDMDHSFATVRWWRRNRKIYWKPLNEIPPINVQSENDDSAILLECRTSNFAREQRCDQHDCLFRIQAYLGTSHFPIIPSPSNPAGSNPSQTNFTMAFVTATPFRISRDRLSLSFGGGQLSRRGATSPRAAMAGPEKPKDFAAPKPRPFFIRPDKAFDIWTGSAGMFVRLGAGALVDGYRLKTENGRLVEYSSTLPYSKPKLPLRLFEFEACPFCRKVREAVSMLDLDLLVFPCPKDGKLYRAYVKSKGGKSQFPYLEDPNTDFAGYESDDIIRYLYKTYGPTTGAVPPVIGSASTAGAGIAQSFRRGKGRDRAKKTVPTKKPIELYGYEASPFSKIVRETLCELELPYYLHTTARGSRSRAELKERTGRFLAPFISDPNTGVEMFESAEICEYLMKTYGPSASGAIVMPEEESVFMPGDPYDVGDEQQAPVPPPEAAEKSLDPQPVKDDALEKYCEDNPESDECRVYD